MPQPRQARLSKELNILVPQVSMATALGNTAFQIFLGRAVTNDAEGAKFQKQTLTIHTINEQFKYQCVVVEKKQAT